MSGQNLVIDNGSYNLKAGFADQGLHKIYNAITRTKDGAVYIGNDFVPHTNMYSGINFKRPFENGHLTLWETEKPIWDSTFDTVSPHSVLDASNTNLILTETPYQLPQLSLNTDQIVFEEYGFSQYYRCTPALLLPWLLFKEQPSNALNDYTLVIDAGYNATWIIPMIYQSVYWEGMRKLPIAGKVLTGLLRETISFRHYDVLEEPLLVNTIKELTTFIAPTLFRSTLANREKHACEFVLPDFKTTTTGFVRTAETPVTPDTQLLRLTDERFVVPEALFQPDIVFDSNTSTASSSVVQAASLKNLPDLVLESIMACPEAVRPLMLANIVIAGGTSQIPNFAQRLELELTKEMPLDWVVRVRQTNEPIPRDEMAWHGGAALAQTDVISNISVSKSEYFEHGANWCQKQFGFKNK